MDGVDAVRILAYYEPRVSELAIRNFGVHRRNFLWMDVAQNWFDLCVGHRARASGCDLAFLVQNGMKWCERNEGAFGPSVLLRVASGRNISPIRTYL